MIYLQTNGIADRTVQFFQTEQLKDRGLWRKFADIFRTQPDGMNGGWRGEYWGKMMRGGCLVYEYTRDKELYEILTETIRDILTVADNNGRVSSYSRDKEFTAWDLWCRKYVILGCEYYLDICTDEAFKTQIITFICRCADYIIAHIGNKNGQIEINDASGNWLGLNSSSILEPMVKLYRFTNNKSYLDFATYIVNAGGAKGVPVFRLAYENKLAPYQYGVSKAYEMISCFEGLLEYYYVTGEQWCKTAVINFANAIIETELSIIGCSGITHELFDYTAARQTVPQEYVSQETCVTVTWMKFCSRLLELTGEAKFADCMEQSFYNAYLGSLNTQRNICAYPQQRCVGENIVDVCLPVDSYSPLLPGKRGVVVGGFQLMADMSYYGCCACIASAGIGVFMKSMVTANEDGITINFFEQGNTTIEHNGVNVTISQTTAYPVEGKIILNIKTNKPTTFTLKVRIPGWTGQQQGYAVYEKEWSDDTIVLDFEMPIRKRVPIQWDNAVIYIPEAVSVSHNPDDDNYMALMRGPLTLAADSRTGKDVGSVFDIQTNGIVCADSEITPGAPCLLKMKFTSENGENIYLMDYASAGKDWKSNITPWLKTK